MDRVGQTSSSISGNALLPHDNALGESCVGEQPASAASLLGLPVELQKTILEYVRITHLVDLRYSVNRSAVDNQRRQKERLLDLQGNSDTCNAHAVQKHGDLHGPS